MIEIKNLTKRYGNFSALSDITLNIERGEVVGLLGPNGAGKTTLMRILTGYMPATEGEVHVDGNEVHENPLAVQRLIGYLPETPPLYMDMRVIDYLRFAAEIKGLDSEKKQARLDYVLSAAHITARKDQIIGRLSKGYRQRVGLAMALVNDPRYLILDEPTVGLDPNQILETRDLLRELAQGERTVIISSHILAEIVSTCNRTVILSKGRLVGEDTQRGLSLLAAGSTALSIEFERNAKQAKTELLEKFSLSRAQVKEDRQVIIYGQALKAARANILRFLMERGYEVLSFSPYKSNLEEIFRKLTLDEKETNR